MQVDQSPSWGRATGVNIAVAGGSRFGVSYMLDGATNTNRFDQTGLNMTAVATTPQFEGPAMRALASNWRVSGIYRFASGAPHSVVAGSDRALTALAN